MPLLAFKSRSGHARQSTLFTFLCFFFVTLSALWFFSRVYGHEATIALLRNRPQTNATFDLLEANESKLLNPSERPASSHWVSPGHHDDEKLPMTHHTASQPEGAPRKAIVVASYMTQNISWLERVPHDWEIYKYVVDDPDPQTTTNLTVPRNQGRETMAYLTFIIDHHASPPDFTIFLHGHYRSWHQQEPVLAKIRALNLTALQRSDYISLRCNKSPGCEAPLGSTTLPIQANEWALQHLPAFWGTIFPSPKSRPQLHRGDLFDGVRDDDPRVTGLLPPTLKGKCCAQFAVSKRAITQMSVAAWERVRAPLLRGPKAYGWSSALNDVGVGLLFEPLWHTIFGKGAEFCPDEDVCRKVHFSDAITCNRYISYGADEELKDITCSSIYPEDEI